MVALVAILFSVNLRQSVRLSIAFPGHALHEKRLQRQIGVGPLVSSQEQRALLVPVINRLQTVGDTCFPRPFCAPNFPVGLRHYRIVIIQLRFNFLCPFGLLLTRLSCS